MFFVLFIQINLKDGGFFTSIALLVFEAGGGLPHQFFLKCNQLLNGGECFTINDGFIELEFGRVKFWFFEFAIFHDKESFIIFWKILEIGQSHYLFINSDEFPHKLLSLA